jgi:hypothetical protein
MTTRQPLRCYYWRENSLIGNMGDALVPILLRALGYEPISQTTSSRSVLNAGRCLIVIGSILTPSHLAKIDGPIDVWGCGWKGTKLAPELLERLRMHAVRGPHTINRLGLPATTPVGDPALLLPFLAPRPIRPHGHTLVVPHYLRARLVPVATHKRLTGCGEVVSPEVIQMQGIGLPGWPRKALSLGKALMLLGLRPHTTWGAVKRIAGATFVLTGSLHGAILAQAYGVPWAAYDDGYIDAPAKWLDWAAFLGIQIEFVSTLADGEKWWQTEGCNGAIRDLSPLLSAFPYPVSGEIHQRCNRPLSLHP